MEEVVVCDFVVGAAVFHYQCEAGVVDCAVLVEGGVGGEGEVLALRLVNVGVLSVLA